MPRPGTMDSRHPREDIFLPPPTPLGMQHGGGKSFKSVVGVATIPNFGKGDPENQDTYVSSQNGSKCFVGVFDGHGERGARLSNFARHHMTQSLFGHQKLHTDPRSALEGAYAYTHKQIETLGPEAQLSGTTAVSAYKHRDKLFVANLGDSRAVLGRCSSSCGDKLQAIDLSSDQKPDRPDEKERILAAGGTVDQMCFPVVHRGSIKWMRAGPERVMDRNGMGGLAMSRSLGDLRLRPYVSCQPEVVERKLDSRDKYLVLGSDGVWDHVSSQEAVSIAGKHDDPNVAAREISTLARRRWQQETEGQMSDDITALVVKFDKDSLPGTPSSIGTPHKQAATPGASERRLSHMSSTRHGERPDILTLEADPGLGRTMPPKRRSESSLTSMLTAAGGGPKRPFSQQPTPARSLGRRPEALPPAGFRRR